MLDPILAWHFTSSTLRDGRPIPPDGEILHHEGPLALCRSGLHASRRILDALHFAPSSIVCRVECGGEMLEEDDKLVCRQRTILWRIDGTKILHAFARQQALRLFHLWDMPEVVRLYLETGDESLREAAWAASWAAAEVAWVASWAATRAAAWAAERASARSSKMTVDKYATESAAKAVAWAIRATVLAAGNANRNAVEATARDAANTDLTAAIEAAHAEEN